MKRDYIHSMQGHWQEQVSEEHLATQLKLYIPTSLGTREAVTAEQRKDAASEIHAFLETDKRVLLLLGDSGAGKTLFGQWLANDCWQRHGPDFRIPLFIHLPAQNIKTFCLENYLINKYEFTDVDIADLKANYRFLLILDAYDEMKIKHRGKNLYRLGQLYKWDIKVIISCRTEALVSFDAIEQRLMFQPCDNFEEPLPLAWEKRYVQFFDPNNDLPQYVERWKRHNPELVQPDWDYLQVLTRLPGLLKMIENPFILWIVMTTLPDLLERYADKPLLERYHETRLELFNTFTTLWFKRQRDKLLKNNLISDTLRESILDDYRSYCEQLANLMWQKKINSITYDSARNPSHGMLAVEYLGQQHDHNDSMMAAFFAIDGHFMGDSEKPLLAYIRQGALLRIFDGNTYAFLHPSLLEYFSAQRLFKSASNKATIAMGLEMNTLLITNDTSRIHFGIDCARRDPTFEQALWDIIEESKSDARVAIAAANAITILVSANKSFAGKDLRRIQIRYANLSEGNFESADLREADLRDVNLSYANLFGANLSGCCLDRIKKDGGFIERLKSRTIACAFSTATPYYGVLTEYSLNIYEVTTHKKLDHPGFRFNPKDGSTWRAFKFLPHIESVLLASDRYLQQISLLNAKVLRQWVAHHKYFNMLITSSNGLWALTKGCNSWHTGELKRWDTTTGKCLNSWKYNTHFTTPPLLSQDGTWALFAPLLVPGNSKTIERWNCVTGKCLAIWEGHLSSVSSMALSPDNLWALSGSDDKTIKRWDCISGVCVATWHGHTADIKQLILSSDGIFALSLAQDNIIKRWDCATGECIATWKFDGPQHTLLALSPDNQWVLSGNNDEIHRWDLLKTELNQKMLRLGHQSSVTALALSLDGHSIHTSSSGYIKRWNYTTGECLAEWPYETPHISAREAIFSKQMPNNYHLTSLDISPHGRQAICVKLGKTINTLVVSPDGHRAFSRQTNGEIKIWNCYTGECLTTWGSREDIFDNWVFAVCFDAGWILFKEHGVIKQLDFTTGEQIPWPSSFGVDPHILVLSISGNIAFSDDNSNNIRSWDCATGRCESIWRGHRSAISALALSHNGLWAASCDKNTDIILWQLSDGKNNRPNLVGVTTLCWAISEPSLLIIGFRDGSVKAYTLDVDTLSLSLRWRSSTNKIQLQNSKMLNVHGLSDIQQLFFSQEGAKVHASTKSSNEIIQQRKQRVPDVFDSPRRSLFDKRYLIYLSYWIITVARPKTGAGAQHAFLILENVEQPSSAEPICYRIRRIDFVLELRHFALPEGAKKPEKTDTFGQGLIEIADKTIDEATRLAENCYHSSAQISAKEGRQLLQAIYQDQQQRLAYCKPGNGNIYRIFRMREAVEHHNCISWIRKHLDAIRADILPDHWTDFLAEIPSNKLN